MSVMDGVIMASNSLTIDFFLLDIWFSLKMIKHTEFDEMENLEKQTLWNSCIMDGI